MRGGRDLPLCHILRSRLIIISTLSLESPNYFKSKRNSLLFSETLKYGYYKVANTSPLV